ncbi:hypothetical protein ACFL6I_19870 [candidate division KSB1 bacterium]
MKILSLKIKRRILLERYANIPVTSEQKAEADKIMKERIPEISVIE